MPDLFEPEDTGSGNRQVIASPEANADTPFEGRIALQQSPSARARDIAKSEVPVLHFEQVSKWYGPVIGINQVSLTLFPGITGLVGPNGAGKSTMLRLAGGQIRPDLGSVRVCGEDAWTPAAKRRIGYCPDVDRFFEEMSGAQFVQTMARLSGYPRKEAQRRTEDAIEFVGMGGRADKTVRGYSKGMRQRIRLAQALVHDPDLLLLDEPLSGIDPLGRKELVDLFLQLAARGKCLLISSHELEELEKLTDHVAIVARGRVAAVGSVVDIRELLDDQPVSIRIGSVDCRGLAMSLMELPNLVGLEIESESQFVVRVRNSREFFQHLANLILEEDVQINHLEPLDDTTHSILEYLLR